MIKRLRPWHVALLICLAYVLLTLARYNFDPKYFALIGTQYDPGLSEGRPGYDGQFAYQIARDPLNGWAKIDVPAYRYQRIVYPIVARLLALGHADLVPWTLIVVNIMALTAGVWLTEEVLRHFGVSRWYALIYGLSAGTLMSVRLNLTEPLAYALAQAGVLLALKGSEPAAISASSGKPSLSSSGSQTSARASPSLSGWSTVNWALNVTPSKVPSLL